MSTTDTQQETSSNQSQQSETKRPFLEYWEELEKLELQRRKGHIADDRYVMTLAFIQNIGPDPFLEQAKDTFAVQEIARFYGVQLQTKEDLSDLLKLVGQSEWHREIFYYAFYFAAWVKKEVPICQRTFRRQDSQILSRDERGGSHQSILRDTVEMIGFLKFRR